MYAVKSEQCRLQCRKCSHVDSTWLAKEKPRIEWDAGSVWLREGELARAFSILLRRNTGFHGKRLIHYFRLEQAHCRHAGSAWLQRSDGRRRQVRCFVQGCFQRIGRPAVLVVPVASLVCGIQNICIRLNLDLTGVPGDLVGEHLGIPAGSKIAGTDFALVMGPDVD